MEALTAAEAKAQFLIQQHKIENRITPMNNTISKAINAAKFGSKVSTKLVDSSVLAAGTILWMPEKKIKFLHLDLENMILIKRWLGSRYYTTGYKVLNSSKQNLTKSCPKLKQNMLIKMLFTVFENILWFKRNLNK